jgi:competence protein ComFC
MHIQHLSILLAQIQEFFFPSPFKQEDLDQFNLSMTLKSTWQHALFSYRDPRVQRLVKYLKKHRDSLLSRVLAEKFYSYLKEHNLINAGPVIIPVPVSQRSMTTRGFNQVQDVSQHLAHLLGGTCITSKSIKKKETQKQALLPRLERASNVRGCFQVLFENDVRDKDCIIVDDLITTGATVYELRTELLRSKARTVIALAIAH